MVCDSVTKVNETKGNKTTAEARFSPLYFVEQHNCIVRAALRYPLNATGFNVDDNLAMYRTQATCTAPLRLNVLKPLFRIFQLHLCTPSYFYGVLKWRAKYGVRLRIF